MAYNPDRPSHVRSYSSPRNELDPFFTTQRTQLLSPPQTPSFPKVKEWSTPVEQPLSPALTYRTDSYRDRPTSYRSYTHEMDDSYPLAERYRTESIHAADQNVQRNLERDESLKKNIRRFRFVVRVLNLGCSLVVVSILIANLALFSSTRALTGDDGDSIWGDEGETKTWPVYVLLAVAIISSFLSIVVLISYLQSVKWANRLAAMHGALSIGASVFLLIIWAISVGIFNIHDHSSATSDLWSWSCNEAESNEYHDVNWSQYCLEQSWCSVCGLIGIAFEILTLTSFLLVFVRRRSKKSLRESQRWSTSLRSASTFDGRFGERRTPATEFDEGYYRFDADRDLKSHGQYGLSEME